MKKTLSLIMAGLLTVAMGTAAFAGHVAEEDRGNIKFGVKGIAETVEWTADGEQFSTVCHFALLGTGRRYINCRIQDPGT